MDRLEQAFAATPRTGFLPRGQRRHAGDDLPLPIGFGQTNSQPRTVVDMLRLLDVPVGAHVLDVGAGSGWTTALLAELVGPTGSVIGTEIVPDLASWGAANLAAVNRPWARIVLARHDLLGWPDEAPFQRVLLSANAVRLPQALVDQLGPAGILVCPVAGRLVCVRRDEDGPVQEVYGHYRFVPLIEP